MRQYMVRRGDTFFGIAKKFGITFSQLLAANAQITNPNNIYAGLMVNIPLSAPSPIPTIYTIMPGDTFRAIAARYGLTLGQMLASNPSITNSNLLSVGMKIVLPGTSPTPGTTIYSIRPGDTMQKIASRFNTTVTLLMGINPDITNPTLIFIGQQIFVPISFNIAPPGCIVFISDITGKRELWQSSALGMNPIQLTGLSGKSPDYLMSVRWSPNGRYISYIGDSDLIIMDSCGQNPRTLAQGVGSYDWAPNGSNIAFSAGTEIYTVNLLGQITKVASLNNDIESITYFSDSRRLAGGLISLIPSTTHAGMPVYSTYTTLFTVDISGQNLKVYDNPYIPGSSLQISPNGRYIVAYWDKEDNDMLFGKIVSYDLTTGILGKFLDSYATLGGFSPDSSKFLYATPEVYGNIRVVSFPEGTVLKTIQTPLKTFDLQWGVSPEWIIYILAQEGSPATPNPSAQIIVYNLINNQSTNIASRGWNVGPDWNIAICPSCR